MISIIVAIAQNNAIGFENKLLYWLPDDLKRFKALTTGHTIIMGRKTFESLPKGALPNRRNIVLSRNATTSFPNTEVFTSLEDALAHCNKEEERFIIGGDSLSKTAIHMADKLYIPAIDDTPVHADAFFPDIDSEKWKLHTQTHHDKDEKHDFTFSFMDYIRKGESQ